MIKHCTDEHWQYMQNLKPAGAPCGRTFDDAECSTLCPHDPLPSKLSEEEIAELYSAVTGDRPLPEAMLRDLTSKAAQANRGKLPTFAREDIVIRPGKDKKG